MTILKSIARLAAIAALCVSPALLMTQKAHAQTVDEIIKRGKVLVAIDTTNAPFGTINDKMEPDGFEVQLAKRMATALGVQLEIVSVTTPNRIPFLITNKADILLATLTITPQRALQVMYTIPYGGVKFGVLAPKTKKIAGPDDLKGLRVGVIRGGAAEPMITAVAPKEAQIVRLDDPSACIQALVSGQVDAIAENWLIPGNIAKAQGTESFEMKFELAESHFGIGVRKGSFDLLQWVNTFIYAERLSGELGKLHQKYVGVPLPALSSF